MCRRELATPCGERAGRPTHLAEITVVVLHDQATMACGGMLALDAVLEPMNHVIPWFVNLVEHSKWAFDRRLDVVCECVSCCC